MPLLIKRRNHHRGLALRADIFAEDETITRIGRDLEAPPGAEIIDATGKIRLSRFIDPHVHIYLPFMATFAKDTHETGECRGADRRHHHLYRDVLPLAHG